MTTEKQIKRHQKVVGKLSNEAKIKLNTRIHVLSNDFLKIDALTLKTRAKNYAVKSIESWRKKDIIENMVMASACYFALKSIYG